MNRTPTPEEVKTEQQTPLKQTSPRKDPKGTPPDLTYVLLYICVAVCIVISIAFLCLLHQKPTEKPQDETTTEAPSETEEPSHTAVTYPSAPSRSSYLLYGNGTVIDGSKLSASSAILVSLSDYSVKASIGADERIYPASMTKIMTLIVACESIEDASVTLAISNDTLEYCRKEGATVLAVDPGDRFSATDMLYAVGVVSAADACITLAEHIFGSEEAFVRKMNEKVSALGLTATNFANCTGLDHDDNYSTAREMAVILSYALDNPFCREILETDNRTVLGYYDDGGVEKTYNRQLYNTLWGRLEGAGYEKKLPASLSCGMTLLGGKTGYTDKGKYCLASFAKDDGGNLYITVTAAGEKSSTSITDMETIFGLLHE